MSVSQELRDLNLISGDKVSETFDCIYSDILTMNITSHGEFIDELWSRYNSITPSLNGKIFEGLLATVFYRSGILPFYVEAKLAFVPNVSFDFVAYSKEYGPIVLSAKTSLRERYKQADLEGMMLRQVHRRSKSYLITLNEKEARTVNDKIETGLVLGLDDVVIANSEGMDTLICGLKKLEYYEPEKIDILSGNRVVK